MEGDFGFAGFVGVKGVDKGDLTETNSMGCVVLTGFRGMLRGSAFPTLKRRANERCAYGASMRLHALLAEAEALEAAGQQYKAVELGHAVGPLQSYRQSHTLLRCARRCVPGLSIAPRLNGSWVLAARAMF